MLLEMICMDFEEKALDEVIRLAENMQISETKLFEITDNNALNNLQYSRLCKMLAMRGYDIVCDKNFKSNEIDSHITDDSTRITVPKEGKMIIYTVKEVADMLKVSESTINRLVKSNKIESFRIGTVTRITEEAIISFIKSGGTTSIDDSSEEE